MHAKISRLIYSYRFQSSRFQTHSTRGASRATPQRLWRRSRRPRSQRHRLDAKEGVSMTTLEKGSAILSPTPELAKAPQIYICLIQGSEEIITKAFYSIADRQEFDLFVDALYLRLYDAEDCFPPLLSFLGFCNYAHMIPDEWIFNEYFNGTPGDCLFMIMKAFQIILTYNFWFLALYRISTEIPYTYLIFFGNQRPYKHINVKN